MRQGIVSFMIAQKMDNKILKKRIEKMFDMFIERLCELKSDKNMKCVFIPELSQADTKNLMAWAY